MMKLDFAVMAILHAVIYGQHVYSHIAALPSFFSPKDMPFGELGRLFCLFWTLLSFRRRERIRKTVHGGYYPARYA